MESIIAVEHLKKYYKDVKAVDDISFEVKKGELFGFLGVNGAGKSTTINILCTLQNPTEGKVTVNGLELEKNKEEIKRLIGVVYQNNCLDKRLPVRENLLCRGSLYEKDSTVLKKSLDRVTEILELKDVLKRPFGKLSGGQDSGVQRIYGDSVKNGRGAYIFGIADTFSCGMWYTCIYSSRCCSGKKTKQ